MAQKAEKQLKSDENGHFSTWNGSASVPVVKKRRFSGLMIFWLLTGRVCSDFPNDSTNCDGAAEK